MIRVGRALASGDCQCRSASGGSLPVPVSLSDSANELRLGGLRVGLRLSARDSESDSESESESLAALAT